jgi:hypothetical protein
MTQPSPPQLMLALDLGGNGSAPTGADAEAAREDVERAISLAASVICDAYLHGCDIGLVVWGAACAPFRLHHTLPHRQRILEALATLDLDRRDEAGGELGGARLEPTVVVRPGASAAGGRVINGRITLGTDQMAAFVKEMDEDVEAALIGTGVQQRPMREQRPRRRFEPQLQ